MKKALILTADGFEDSELLVPYRKLKEKGIEVKIASLQKKELSGKHGAKVEVDESIDEVDPKDYDILILPGGKAPALLRKDERVLKIVKYFITHDKPVAAICHGPQILISAGVVKGRHMTGYKKIADELVNAGAIYEDRPVVIDKNLITSRVPADLDAFVEAILHALSSEKEQS